MLWMYQRTFFGKPNERNAAFIDLSGRDWLPLLPLLALMVWLGCYTQPFLQPISAATSHLLEQSAVNDQYRVSLRLPRSASAF
jgi:NADH-quinone oxidoreductase subunit M